MESLNQPQIITPQVGINQRVAILIDGNNLEKSLHSLLNSSDCMIDFDKFIPNVLQGRQLTRVIYFREGKTISNKLSSRLNSKYFGTVMPCLKSADVPLTIAAVQLCEKVDTIIIGSGDADYVSLVKFLNTKGVRVEVAGVRATLSFELSKCADNIYDVSEKDTWKFVKPEFRKTFQQTNLEVVDIPLTEE